MTRTFFSAFFEREKCPGMSLASLLWLNGWFDFSMGFRILPRIVGRRVSASIPISRSLYLALWDAVFRQANISYNDCCAVSKLS